jgi:hypothetical protein
VTASPALQAPPPPFDPSSCFQISDIVPMISMKEFLEVQIKKGQLSNSTNVEVSATFCYVVFGYTMLYYYVLCCGIMNNCIL